jgi:hypothetical protein
MGQLPVSPLNIKEDTSVTKTSLSRCIPHPVLLPCPVSEDSSLQRDLREVWCGSEYTVASDAEGFLWGCGWNEHGNLSRRTGIADTFSSSSLPPPPSAPSYELYWTPVIHITSLPLDNIESTSSKGYEESLKRQVQLAEVWEGAMSCGGAHCLSFAFTK